MHDVHDSIYIHRSKSSLSKVLCLCQPLKALWVHPGSVMVDNAILGTDCSLPAGRIRATGEQADLLSDTVARVKGSSPWEPV